MGNILTCFETYHTWSSSNNIKAQRSRLSVKHDRYTFEFTTLKKGHMIQMRIGQKGAFSSFIHVQNYNGNNGTETENCLELKS